MQKKGWKAERQKDWNKAEDGCISTMKKEENKA